MLPAIFLKIFLKLLLFISCIPLDKIDCKYFESDVKP